MYEATLAEQVAECGWPGWVTLLVGVVALVVAIVTMSVVVLRRPGGRILAPLALAIAILPVGVGIYGTSAGRARVDSALEGGAVAPDVAARIRAQGYREANSCTSISVSVGFFPFMLGFGAFVLVMFMPARKPEPGSS